MSGARMRPSAFRGVGSRGYSHYIMDASSAAMTWGGARRLSRSMVLGGLLAAAVFLGLLTMHGHSGPPLTPPAVAVQSGTMHTATDVNAMQPAQSPVSCADCLENGIGLVMDCMFGLLVALGIVLSPRLSLARALPNLWRAVVLCPTVVALLRPPSLHMLCISRR